MEVENGEESILIFKIKSVLFKLISPQFKISDDTVLQKLFDCISQIFSVKDYQDPLLQVFIPWVEVVISDWNNIDSKSRAFSLRIMSLVCSNENNLSLLLNCSILKDICSFIRNSKESDFSVILAYLELIHSIVKSPHPGCPWVLENGIWKDVLSILRSDQTLYAQRQSHNVLSDFVVCIAAKNLSISYGIFDEILLPCFEMLNESKNTLQMSLAMKRMAYQQVYFHGSLNYLNLIVLFREIILKMLGKKFTYNDIDTIVSKYNLRNWIFNSIESTENVGVITELSRLLSVLHISMVRHNENGSVDYTENRRLCRQFLDHIDLLIKKQHLILIQEVCIEYFKLWNEFGGEIVNIIKDAESNDTYAIENTIFIILTVPVFMFIKILQSDSELMEAFAERIFGIACVQTRRVAYSFKSQIKKRDDISIETVASTSVRCFVRIANICKKEQGVVIFQTLVHILLKIVPMNDLSGTMANLSSYELLSATLEALHCYISKFHLTWSDSLETVCVMPLLQRLVCTKDISPRMTIDILKLQRASILGYLPTNMALLMDTLQGTSVQYLGHQICNLLHSVHWEIRDSTIELLQSICLLAEHKIPVLQQLILDDKLPSLLVSIFENDSEAYVRASSLTCLSYIVRIESLWENSLADQSLVEKILYALLHDPEGIVRHKAILLLKEMYQFKHLRSNELEKAIDVLYHITLTDLHWEVTNGAIIFWDCVLESKLIEEGMVDGCFPDKIFSSEKKKIIKLTPTETSSRILRVFECLSNFGCLYALWHIVQDHCDFEVTREAGKLITKMIDLVNKFNVPVKTEKVGTTWNEINISSEKNSLKRKMSFDENETKIIVPENARAEAPLNGLMHTTDEVIESIVAEGDIDLVCGLLRNVHSKEDSKLLLPRKSLSLDVFYLNVVKYDIIGKQQEKTKWLSETSDGLSSLLDDILVVNTFDTEKTNIIDCY